MILIKKIKTELCPFSLNKISTISIIYLFGIIPIYKEHKEWFNNVPDGFRSLTPEEISKSNGKHVKITKSLVTKA